MNIKRLWNSLSANPDLLIDIFKETDLDDVEKGTFQSL